MPYIENKYSQQDNMLEYAPIDKTSEPMEQLERIFLDDQVIVEKKTSWISKLLPVKIVNEWWSKRDWKEKNRSYRWLMAVSVIATMWAGSIWGKVSDPSKLECLRNELLPNVLFDVLVLIVLLSEALQERITSTLHKILGKKVTDLVNAKGELVQNMNRLAVAGLIDEVENLKGLYTWYDEQERKAMGVV
ncbi:hypothetical protein [Butyrivibrio proteoclasticus]|uniref:hypothetical protein n=1 Tax=Butyrivibrio proteoclasticus TaxID=43305 RepID=UPI00047D0E61|nr:hypothetical protein [Butyrivibrio proteoclasticus]